MSRAMNARCLHDVHAAVANTTTTLWEQLP